MNKKISLLCIFLCVGLCGCHKISPEYETGLERKPVSRELTEEKTDFWKLITISASRRMRNR